MSATRQNGAAGSGCCSCFGAAQDTPDVMQDKHAKAENNPIATAGGFQPNGIATAEGFQPNGIATDTAFHSILSNSMFEKQAQVTPYQNAPDVYLRSGDPSRISRPTTPVSLPWSPTPQDSPRTPARSSVAGHSEQGSHLPQYKNDMLDDGSRLKTLDGKWVEASSVELLIRQATPAIGQCILVTHATSDDVGCLITLKSAPGISGLALDLAGLNLANKCGSEAATIMSARSCAVFRRGLAHELENVNAKLIPLSVQVRRFQVLREFFTVDNGLLLPDLTPNRVAITNRYRHLIDDMFQHETHFPHKWMQQPNDEDIIIRAESSENDVHRNYSMLHPREPSPRRCPSPGSTTSFSKRQPSPRKSRHPSPLRADQAHLSSLPPPPGLPLDLDGIVGSANNTPRIDRGRYSPTFTALQTSVLPYDKISASTGSIVPVGRGPMGLPVGGANFDGFARSCNSTLALSTLAGRPPRPQGRPRTPPLPLSRNPQPVRVVLPVYTPDNPDNNVVTDIRQISPRLDTPHRHGNGEWSF